MFKMDSYTHMFGVGWNHQSDTYPHVLTHPNTHPEVYEVYGGLLKLGLPQFIQVWTYLGFKPMVLEISF